MEEKLGRNNLNVFVGVNVKTQVVAGLNYLFEVQIGDEEVVHVKIHKPLPHTGQPPVLMTVTEAK